MCFLAVREGNLVVRVDLGSKMYPAGSRLQQVKDIARSAVQAASR
ncbi:hypothetical protein [Streptomyces sp. NPDC096339]